MSLCGYLVLVVVLFLPICDAVCIYKHMCVPLSVCMYLYRHTREVGQDPSPEDWVRSFLPMCAAVCLYTHMCVPPSVCVYMRIYTHGRLARTRPQRTGSEPNSGQARTRPNGTGSAPTPPWTYILPGTWHRFGWSSRQHERARQVGGSCMGSATCGALGLPARWSNCEDPRVEIPILPPTAMYGRHSRQSNLNIVKSWVVPLLGTGAREYAAKLL